MQAQQPNGNEQFIQALNTSLDEHPGTAEPGCRAAGPPPPNLGPGLYIKGYTSPIKFHIDVFQHRDARSAVTPMISSATPQTQKTAPKHLTETDRYKSGSFQPVKRTDCPQSPARILDDLPGLHYPQRLGFRRPHQSGHCVQRDCDGLQPSWAEALLITSARGSRTRKSSICWKSCRC